VKKAIAIVAHDDDLLIWMGGTIQRLSEFGWDWTVIALCTADRKRKQYFLDCCTEFRVSNPIPMGFLDHQGGEPFSGENNRDKMLTELRRITNGQTFDLAASPSHYSRRPSVSPIFNTPSPKPR